MTTDAELLRRTQNLEAATQSLVAQIAVMPAKTQTSATSQSAPSLPRIDSIISSPAPVPNADTADLFIITLLSIDATMGTPAGTPGQGQLLRIRIKDDGTSRAITWDAIYRAVGSTPLASTVPNKTWYGDFIYNLTDLKWDCLGSHQEP